MTTPVNDHQSSVIDETGNNDLWSLLSNESTEAGQKFMPHYRELDDALGNSLKQLEHQKHDIQGRDREMELLHAILERPNTPVCLLLGQAGVGKTALVEEFVKQINTGTLKTNVDKKYMVIALRLGVLASLGVSELQTQLATLLDRFKALEKVAQEALHDDRVSLILFMDEIHMIVTIFGAGTKVGGDVMKDVLARAPVRVIGATTKREYDSTIAVDKPLSERFKQIEMTELPKELVMEIVSNWWEKNASDCPLVSKNLISLIIDAGKEYRSDSAEPRKTLDIMEDLVSYCRRTGLPATRRVIGEIFKMRYSISLDMAVDGKTVFDNINRRVFGQPYAKYELDRAMLTLEHPLDPMSGKPRLSMLFTGPTGVGKTETAKAIAEGMHPSENSLLKVPMQDYSDPRSKPDLQKYIGEYVRHTPDAVILLDEIDKVPTEVLDVLLSMTDEGELSFSTMNREGRYETNTVSLRNTVLICTTNAGADVFATDAAYSQRREGNDVHDAVSEAEVESLMTALRNELQNGKTAFRPEFMGRFDHIIAFRSLTTDALLKIGEKKVNNAIETFERNTNIDVVRNEKQQWPKDLYDFVTDDVSLYITFVKANAQDSNSGGARAIAGHVMKNVYTELLVGHRDNPGARRLKIEVSKDAKIYSPQALNTAGGVKVSAI